MEYAMLHTLAKFTIYNIRIREYIDTSGISRIWFGAVRTGAQNARSTQSTQRRVAHYNQYQVRVYIERTLVCLRCVCVCACAALGGNY